jgi:hypothetical protein
LNAYFLKIKESFERCSAMINNSNINKNQFIENEDFIQIKENINVIQIKGNFLFSNNLFIL